MATLTEKEGLRDGRHAGKGQCPYHCSPRQRLASKPSNWSTCCMVTSAAQPVEVDAGHAVPRAVGGWMGGERRGPFRSHYLYRERGTVLFSALSPRVASPPAVWRIRPACSSDSRASPRRWFWTDSRSRSLARVNSRARNQAGEHLVLEITWPVAGSLRDNLQVGGRRVGGHQLQRHGRRCRSGAVLTQQHQALADRRR